MFSMVLFSLFLAGCGNNLTQEKMSLTQARTGFKTRVFPRTGRRDSVDVPPAGVFDLVKYKSPGGPMPAYLTPNPGDGKRHPAIVWITGGDCNSIGDVWSPQSQDNDQSAAAYRKAGLVMMFPSLRGGNLDPGAKEGFLGEVDDVLAATDYLEKQPYVDPKRIYLGGHSTGGTLALLVAESSSRYRAVFSFGPIADVRWYGQAPDILPFDTWNDQEVKLRSPGYWLSSIQSPVWVIEGTEESNIKSLRAMEKASQNPKAHFVALEAATHFNCLAPTNNVIAQKLLQDTGDTLNISLTAEDVYQSMR